MSNIELMFIANSVLWFAGFGIWSRNGIQMIYKILFLGFAIVNLLFGLGKLY